MAVHFDREYNKGYDVSGNRTECRAMGPAFCYNEIAPGFEFAKVMVHAVRKGA